MCAFKFWLTIIINDVMAAILIGKSRELTGPQFLFGFLEILI